ncbi:MAG: bifunctional diaminohydroxyphosphoribosylaminopyrimidine deaminase/5-amino-6-(5-phosphoribosylamino)uracil reductase RibD [Algoriphagus sp.]|jgi:diaminohydroxyphosphoribosylaminopyrimidine deaminase/5-amino-6-(5-phosphoribosylamino)uracil reductase|nr:bifunctional diaminohydroxyphosphoribosylaminopyrimidine deaminase/5-amino-6-(5-phosphoribosylamino)uracil reductase RibD [Algoriphagus sp.]
MNPSFFMQRALDLAERGKGAVRPNPLVGCVLVHEGKIIGEGYHEQYGGPHAEVNAIATVTDPKLLAAATAYVSLEPCSHYGKTPPCANLLVEKGIKSVVVATLDPNPLVAGKGVKLLEEAGISVQVGLLEREARWQNRRFFCQQEKHRPYLILKWAQTQDGFIARKNFDSKWISCSQSRQLVHQWRAAEQAILVGKNTALHDNPRLNVRDWTGSDPIRVVLDSKLELPADLHLFDQQIPTLCYNLLKSEKLTNLEWVQLPQLSLEALMADLHARQIQSVLIEGGSQTIHQFLAAGLWDEARVFTAPIEFERGISAPKLTQTPAKSYAVGVDQLDIYYHG